MSLENDFLAKLIDSNDYDTVLDSQISVKHLSGRYKRAFRYIQEFKQKYAKVPSRKEFLRKFSDIDLPESLPESLNYYCDAIKEKQKHNILVQAIEEASEKINELETTEAYKLIKNAITVVENDIITSKHVSINTNTSERKNAYNERKNGGGITGLPTGIKPWDLITGGVQLTDLILIAAKTGVGKSFFLVLIAVLMAKMGYKVLFITREISPEGIAKRADAMWCGFSYTAFNKGKLTPEEEEFYFKYLEDMEESEYALTFENAIGGVISISAMIDRHKPDICLVDGGYLMTDDEEEDNWKGLINVCRGFKNIALSKKVPIITTLQMSGEGKASLNSLSFSKHTADEADAVFAMEQVDMQKEMKEMTIKPLKLRDSEMTGRFVLKWDLDKMDFSPQWMEGVFEKPPEQLEQVQKLEEEKPKVRKLQRQVI